MPVATVFAQTRSVSSIAVTPPATFQCPASGCAAACLMQHRLATNAVCLQYEILCLVAAVGY